MHSIISFKSQVSYFILLILLFADLVSGHGKLFVGLISYSGHDNRDVSGECCDPDGPDDVTCWDPCDFVVQVSAFGLDGKNVTNNRMSGLPLSQSGKVEFPIPMLDKTTVNPSLFTFRAWTGEVTISAQVMDLDAPEGRLQLVDEFILHVQMSAPSQMYQCVTVPSALRKHTRLEVAVRYTCDPSYAGHDCGTDCLNWPQDEMCSLRARRREGMVTSEFLGNPLAKCPLPHVTRPTPSPVTESPTSKPHPASVSTVSVATATNTDSNIHKSTAPGVTSSSHPTDRSTPTPGVTSSTPTPGVTSSTPTPGVTSSTPTPTQSASSSVIDLDKLSTGAFQTSSNPATDSTSTLPSSVTSDGSSTSAGISDRTLYPSISLTTNPALPSKTDTVSSTTNQPSSTQMPIVTSSRHTDLIDPTIVSTGSSSVNHMTTDSHIILSTSTANNVEQPTSVHTSERTTTPSFNTASTHETTTNSIGPKPTNNPTPTLKLTATPSTQTSQTSADLQTISVIKTTESPTPTVVSSSVTEVSVTVDGNTPSVTTFTDPSHGRNTSSGKPDVTTPRDHVTLTSRDASTITSRATSPSPSHTTHNSTKRASPTPSSERTTASIETTYKPTDNARTTNGNSGTTEPTNENASTTSRDHEQMSSMMPLTAEDTSDDDAMKYWAPIVGGCLGGLAVVGIVGYFVYRSRQRALIKHQEIYVVSPPMSGSIEENGTSGRSDVPMTTALL